MIHYLGAMMKSEDEKISKGVVVDNVEWKTDNEIPVLEEKPKRKYTKRKKKTEVVELPLKSREFLSILFNEILARRNEIWKLANEELNSLSTALDNVIVKYLPSFDRYSEEFTLLAVCGTIFIPRLLLIRKDRKVGKEKQNNNDHRP